MLPDPTEILLTYKLPLTPTPPLTTKAPVVELVDVVVEVITKLPLALLNTIFAPVNALLLLYCNCPDVPPGELLKAAPFPAQYTPVSV